MLAETRIGRRYARLAARAGAPLADRAALEEMLAPHGPERRPRPAARLFLAAGAHDRIALGAGTLRLGRAWGGEVRVYPRGHLTLLFACRALRRDLGRFLREPLAPLQARAPLA